MKKAVIFIAVCFFLLVSRPLASFIPFQVVAPKKNSVVREAFKVKIPRLSMPKFSYVAFWADKRFLGAFKPIQSEEHYVFIIDSKKFKIPDGKVRLSAFLYLEEEGRTRILTSCSTPLHVQNYSGTLLPKEGLKLRYSLPQDRQLRYQFKEYVRAESEKSMPLQPAANYQIVYDIQSIEKGSNSIKGLVRTRALPLKGESAVRARSAQDAQKSTSYKIEETTPIYQKILDTGHEDFGEIAPIMALDDQSLTEVSKGGERLFYPKVYWPLLPEQRVVPGAKWDGFVQADYSALGKQRSNHLAYMLPAECAFERLEWIGNHLCAKLTYRIRPIERSAENESTAPFLFDKVEQTIWLDLNRGYILKFDGFQRGKFLVPSAKEDEKKSSEGRSVQMQKIFPQRPGAGFEDHEGFEDVQDTFESQGSIGSKGRTEPLVLHAMMNLIE